MAKFVPNRHLDDELKRSKTFQLAISEDVQKAARYAKNFAPVGTTTHYTKAGYKNTPGDYQRSIKVVIKGNEVLLTATDWKAHWIEWGSVHNTPKAPLRRGIQAAGLEFKESSK